MGDLKPYKEIAVKDAPMGQITLKEKESPGQTSKRFSIALTQELVDHLEKQMKSDGISLAEAVRRSLARDSYIQEKLKAGAEIYMLGNGQWHMLR